MFAGRGRKGNQLNCFTQQEQSISPWQLKSLRAPFNARFLTSVQEFGSIERNNIPCQPSMCQMTRANEDFPTISTVSIFDFVINLITLCLALKTPGS